MRNTRRQGWRHIDRERALCGRGVHRGHLDRSESERRRALRQGRSLESQALHTQQHWRAQAAGLVQPVLDRRVRAQQARVSASKRDHTLQRQLHGLSTATTTTTATTTVNTSTAASRQKRVDRHRLRDCRAASD